MASNIIGNNYHQYHNLNQAFNCNNKLKSEHPHVRIASNWFIIGLIVLIVHSQSIQIVSSCALRKFNRDSYVCVCDESYCDSLIEIESPPTAHVHMYETSRDGLRFHKSVISLIDAATAADLSELPNNLFGSTLTLTINLNPSQRFQTINVGFGGTISDSTSLNILSLSNRMGESVIRDCFGPDGLEYRVARIPIGTSEASTRDYSLAEAPSSTLDDFALADEDIWYKIPVIKKAITLQPELKLIASPWTAPIWMSNLKKGRPYKAPIKGEPTGHYYKLWALYMVKFLQAYQKHGINFWALTSGNKPYSSFMANGPMGVPMLPYQQKTFIDLVLGPTLNQSGFFNHSNLSPPLKLLILDDYLAFSNYYWIPLTLDDPVSKRLVSGIAFHWYKNDFNTKHLLNLIHSKYPNHLLISTEAAEGTRPNEEKVSLGSWKRAENYGQDIIKVINHWTNGWIDSNLALDMIGGPSKSRKFQDSPIIINSIHNEYYKQPSYYMLAHFTKFIGPGSVRIGHSMESHIIDNVHLLTMINQDSYLIVIILNTNEHPVEIRINGFAGGIVWQTISAKTIQTYIGQQQFKLN